VFLGPSGVGKTHLAIALGQELPCHFLAARKISLIDDLLDPEKMWWRPAMSLAEEFGISGRGGNTG
jgi:DNA polymerase III delta prime subunit